MVFKMVLNHYAANAPIAEQSKIIAHELGHLWGIADLYKFHDGLDSIYCNGPTVTRHDLNVMRIGLGNPEFETADGRWKYQKSPNVWAENEWINGYYYNSEGYRTTAYIISLNNNGGIAGTESVTALPNSHLPSITPPSRRGYTFEDYFDTSAASGGTKYYNADGTSARPWDKSSNTTLYARWSANTYTVTLDSNGGTGGTPYVTAAFGQNMPAAAMPIREGYIFHGYFDTEDLTGGIKYYNVDGTSTRAWDKASNTTLYARWEQIKFTIHFNANGGSGAPEPQTKIYDVDLTLSTVRPKKDDAFFVGWATSSTATKPDFRPGDTYTAEIENVLYAVYADITDLAITADGTAGADGTIQSPAGVDVYKFTAPKSGSYQIYFSNMSGDTTVNVYDADEEPVNHTLHYYDLTGGQAYYVEVINPTTGQYLYSLHVDMSTESHYYMDSSEGNIWLANDFYGNLYSDNRAGTLFRIDKASTDGFPVGYTISADRMYDFSNYTITIPASSPQYLTYTPSTLTRPDPAGGKASMEPYSGTGGQRWDISQLPNSNEYFITSTEGTLEQLLTLNTQMPRPFMVSRTAYSSCQEARFTFSSRIDMPVENGTYRIANQSTNLSLGVQSGKILHSNNQDIWDIEWQDNGFYKIYWHSDPNQVLAYDAYENEVILDADAGRNSQMWKIARCADGALRISPANSYQMIAVSSMTSSRSGIRLKDDTFDASGKWSFTQIITDGIYEIQGKTSGKLIHAEHTLNGAPAHLWQPAETLYQKMRFELLDDGAYRITMPSGDGRVLTNPQSTSNGTELEFRDWTGADYQRWFVVDCGDGYFKLVNKYSRLVVDISENGTANGTRIQQWQDTGVSAQRFRLIPIA